MGAYPHSDPICPKCRVEFDPTLDTIQRCSLCADDVSTACCLLNNGICIDCDAEVETGSKLPQ